MRPLLCLLILCICAALNSAELTQSIVPTLNEALSGELFSPAKYSSEQGQQIRQLLARTDEKIRIVSYNILFTIYEHQSPAEHRWTERRAKVIEALNSLDPDVICVQEMLHHQFTDLFPALRDRYAFYGRGTEDGLTKGEVNGVFYRTDRLDLLNGEVIWLTDTPDTPSIDAFGKGHTLTVAALRDRVTGKAFQVANTHVAFRNVNSRNNNVHMIANIATERCALAPFILCGDFNAFPQIPLMGFPFFDGDHIERTLLSAPLRNAQIWALLGRYGPQSTFTNASPTDTRAFKGTGTPGVMLDRCYVSSGVTVLIHAVDPVRVDGQFPSDHMPLIIDVLIGDE